MIICTELFSIYLTNNSISDDERMEIDEDHDEGLEDLFNKKPQIF